MKKIQLHTTHKKLLADVFTPVGIYLRLRDRFRDTILLESTDHHAVENSYSYIAVNAIAGIEVTSYNSIDIKFPGENPHQHKFKNKQDVLQHLQSFIDAFEVEGLKNKSASIAQGLFGYTSYDAVQLFDTIEFNKTKPSVTIPLIRYRLYQYVIAINHFKDEMFVCENHLPGLESEISVVESLIRNRDVPVFPFKSKGSETSGMNDREYMEMVDKGIQHCLLGDVFQVVLSRSFQQSFAGDEFNVYRALRNINPSPYLFYFDYGDYKLMGSSPESQLLLKDNMATVHPIAGTIKRTGNDEQDKALAATLMDDAKENAEHVMLVDLARNDLSKLCNNISISYYRQAHYYSHVIHLVSEVTGMLSDIKSPFKLLSAVFPAGTLSGAPKFKAMEIIDNNEPASRSYYGGCIGHIGFDGSLNHAIIIRSFLSKENTLHYQAGAGVVSKSVSENELQEVNNKIAALRQAIQLAETL